MSAVCGVYVVNGPAGVYVGETVDCFRRNDQVTKLGLDWGIVVEFSAETTKRERMRVETLVADAWARRGFNVVSKNTTAARSALQLEIQNRPDVRVKKRAARMAPEARRRRAEILADPEMREKLASWRGRQHSAATKAKISAAHLGQPKTREARERMSISAKIRAARLNTQPPSGTWSNHQRWHVRRGISQSACLHCRGIEK